MRIIGIHDGHNAAAALSVEGRIVSAVQEERLVGVKNKGGFPVHAIEDILTRNRLTPDDIDFIVFAGHARDGYSSREDILNRYHKEIELANSVKTTVRSSLRDNPFLRSVYGAARARAKGSSDERFQPVVEIGFSRNKIKTVEHHSCHTASAYCGLGRYDDTVLVLTCDGAGDGLCATVNLGKKGSVERIASIPEGESIARIYAMMTYLMGMVPLEHEYKIMGLAPYAGTSKSVERVYRRFDDLFEFDRKNPMVWRRRKGVPAVFYMWNTLAGIMHAERFDHISAGLQMFVEKHISEWVRHCVQETGIRKVALSGGIFMNVKMNKIILELPEIEELFVFPSCGDETNAVGAAHHIYNEVRQENKDLVPVAPLSDIYWGGQFTDKEVEAALGGYSFKSRTKWEYVEDIEKRTAALLAKGEIVARAKGRMEFGARALGNRSILANANSLKSLRKINDMIKCRDFWMPFAPSVLSDDAEKYVVKPKKMPSPYMMMTFDTIRGKRDIFIAAIHPYDFTARIQEVFQAWNTDYHRLIEDFRESTGEGIILNTSFNLHGFPIVYKPEEALFVLDNSGLTHLALGNFLIQKSEA